MYENNLDAGEINTLQITPISPTIYYLGALFTVGVVIGSIAGMIMTKEK